MKIKCKDGIVRNFRIAHVDGDDSKEGRDGTWESKCYECGETFGVHDTKILKQRWRNHICKNK